MRLWLLIAAALSLVGCDPSPSRVVRNVPSVGDSETYVDVIAQFEGVTLYRIRSSQNPNIFVAVRDHEARVEWERKWQQGKTTRREQMGVGTVE